MGSLANYCRRFATGPQRRFHPGTGIRRKFLRLGYPSLTALIRRLLTLVYSIHPLPARFSSLPALPPWPRRMPPAIHWSVKVEPGFSESRRWRGRWCSWPAGQAIKMPNTGHSLRMARHGFGNYKRTTLPAPRRFWIGITWPNMSTKRPMGSRPRQHRRPDPGSASQGRTLGRPRRLRFGDGTARVCQASIAQQMRGAPGIN
jgi:hypothetical protein